MRRFILVAVALLVSSLAYAAYINPQTYYAGPPQITCDLTSGVASVNTPCTAGVTCDGAADAAPGFWAFRTWAIANQGTTIKVVLTI